MDEPVITFTNEDARKLHHSHDNVIVITLTIVNYTTRRVLVDSGSSVNILYYLASQQIRIEGTKVLPMGTISLPVMVGSYPQQITKEVNFLVVDCLSS